LVSLKNIFSTQPKAAQEVEHIFSTGKLERKIARWHPYTQAMSIGGPSSRQIDVVIPEVILPANVGHLNGIKSFS
jgi:hypothetical protein